MSRPSSESIPDARKRDRAGADLLTLSDALGEILHDLNVQNDVSELLLVALRHKPLLIGCARVLKWQLTEGKAIAERLDDFLLAHGTLHVDPAASSAAKGGAR